MTTCISKSDFYYINSRIGVGVFGYLVIQNYSTKENLHLYFRELLSSKVDSSIHKDKNWKTKVGGLDFVILGQIFCLYKIFKISGVGTVKCYGLRILKIVLGNQCYKVNENLEATLKINKLKFTVTS